MYVYIYIYTYICLGQCVPQFRAIFRSLIILTVPQRGSRKGGPDQTTTFQSLKHSMFSESPFSDPFFGDCDIRPFSYLRFRKFRSRVRTTLKLVGGPRGLKYDFEICLPKSRPSRLKFCFVLLYFRICLVFVCYFYVSFV